MSDSEMVVNDEYNSIFEDMERKLDTHTTYVVNSCQGKVAGVLV